MTGQVKPLHVRRSAMRPSDPTWIDAPGPAKKKPRAPKDLAEAGTTWWRAAWRSQVSGLWDAAEIEQVRRGARLADACADANPKATLLTELRRLEDALGLTRAGRLRLRIHTPERIEQLGAHDDDRMQRHREMRRRLESA